MFAVRGGLQRFGERHLQHGRQRRLRREQRGSGSGTSNTDGSGGSGASSADAGGGPGSGGSSVTTPSGSGGNGGTENDAETSSSATTGVTPSAGGTTTQPSTTGPGTSSGGASGSGGTTTQPTTGVPIPSAAETRALCEEAYEVIDGCGLLSEGDSGCGNVYGLPAFNCVFQCQIDATCAELEALLCGEPLATDPLPACVLGCLEEATMVTCDNGVTISETWLCDTEDDCGDGSDEAGCPSPFTCGSGEVLPGSWVCDDENDCDDGSDELGCPANAETACPTTPSP